MARKGSVDSVSNIVGKLLGKMEKKYSSKKGQLFSRWEEIVGKDLAVHVVPEKIQNNKLFLNVDSSVWIFEINKREKENIIRNIEDVIGEGIIEDLVLKVGDT